MCDAMRDLVQFKQFKKKWKQPWGSVTFSKTKSNTRPRMFFTYFKLYKWY